MQVHASAEKGVGNINSQQPRLQISQTHLLYFLLSRCMFSTVRIPHRSINGYICLLRLRGKLKAIDTGP